MANRPVSAEIHPGPGFRIGTRAERPNRALINAFSDFETTDISDMLNRLYACDSEIQNVVNTTALVGSAVTVKVFPGDNLMVHKALELIDEGDIIVVDTSGSRDNAIIGELIANKARHYGAAGFIIDGLVRDLPGLKALGMPVFARGICPTGPLHRGPGEINYPINCGGVVVKCGDIVVADPNGVVIVNQESAADVLSRLRRKRVELEDYVREVKLGNFNNAWVNKLLDSMECEVEGETDRNRKQASPAASSQGAGVFYLENL